MSYILEAIKKSDQERKQGEIPDIHTLHVPLINESSSSAMKTWLILLLMIINVVFLAWIIMDDREIALPMTTGSQVPITEGALTQEPVSDTANALDTATLLEQMVK